MHARRLASILSFVMVLALALTISMGISGCGTGPIGSSASAPVALAIPSHVDLGPNKDVVVETIVVDDLTPDFGPIFDNNLAVASVENVQTLTLGQIIGLRRNDYAQSRICQPTVWLGITEDSVRGTLYWGHATADIGPGYSGSQVVMKLHGKMACIGTLSFGWEGNTRDFLITPSQELLALQSASKQGSLKSAPRSWLPAGQIRSLAARPTLSLGSTTLRRQAENRMGRFAERASQFLFVRKDESASTTPTHPDPIDSVIKDSQTVVLPILEGDDNGWITGTLSFVLDHEELGFGHELDNTGLRSLPAYLGDALGLASDGDGVHKDARRTTKRIGDLTMDTLHGVVFTEGTNFAPVSDLVVSSNIGATTKTITDRLAEDYIDADYVRFMVSLNTFDDTLHDWFAGTAVLTIDATKGGKRHGAIVDGTATVQLVPLSPGDVAPTITVTSADDVSYDTARVVDTCQRKLAGIPGQYQKFRVTATFTLK